MAVSFVVKVASDASVDVVEEASVEISSETSGGQSTLIQGKVSSGSPLHFPPFLAGITTARSLFLNEGPQVAEHFPQSLQTDHKQSEGKIDTTIAGSADVTETGLIVVALSFPVHVFASGPKLKDGGQVHI